MIQHFFIAEIISGFKIENMGNGFTGFEMDINTFKKRGRGRRGHDRIAVGFTTTYLIGAYNH